MGTLHEDTGVSQPELNIHTCTLWYQNSSLQTLKAKKNSVWSNLSQRHSEHWNKMAKGVSLPANGVGNLGPYVCWGLKLEEYGEACWVITFISPITANEHCMRAHGREGKCRFTSESLCFLTEQKNKGKNQKIRCTAVYTAHPKDPRQQHPLQ